MSTDNTRDIVIQTKAELDALRDHVTAMSGKVDEMHGIMMQAKGARWAIMAIAAMAGFVGAKIGAIIPWLRA